MPDFPLTSLPVLNKIFSDTGNVVKLIEWDPLMKNSVIYTMYAKIAVTIKRTIIGIQISFRLQVFL